MTPDASSPSPPPPPPPAGVTHRVHIKNDSPWFPCQKPSVFCFFFSRGDLCLCVFSAMCELLKAAGRFRPCRWRRCWACRFWNVRHQFEGDNRRPGRCNNVFKQGGGILNNTQKKKKKKENQNRRQKYKRSVLSQSVNQNSNCWFWQTDPWLS